MDGSARVFERKRPHSPGGREALKDRTRQAGIHPTGCHRSRRGGSVGAPGPGVVGSQPRSTRALCRRELRPCGPGGQTRPNHRTSQHVASAPQCARSVGHRHGRHGGWDARGLQHLRRDAEAGRHEAGGDQQHGADVSRLGGSQLHFTRPLAQDLGAVTFDAHADPGADGIRHGSARGACGSHHHGQARPSREGSAEEHGRSHAAHAGHGHGDGGHRRRRSSQSAEGRP